MSLHGLSSKYRDMPLTLQCVQVFLRSCKKLTDAIKHSDISGTSELLIKWYGIVAQCAALLMYTIHTCYTRLL